MPVEFLARSLQYTANGNGDPFTDTLNPSEDTPGDPTSVGDLLILIAGGRYNAADGETITVPAGWTLLGDLDQEDITGGTTRQRLAVWGKIATSSDISSGVEVTFSASYGTNFTRSRCAQVLTYTGARGINLVAGPVYDGFPDPASPPETFEWPDPSPSGAVTIFCAGMGRFSDSSWPTTREGFTRQAYITPQVNYSMVLLDEFTTSPPVDMSSHSVAAAVGGISFALRDRSDAGWKVGTL